MSPGGGSTTGRAGSVHRDILLNMQQFIPSPAEIALDSIGCARDDGRAIPRLRHRDLIGAEGETTGAAEG